MSEILHYSLILSRYLVFALQTVGIKRKSCKDPGLVIRNFFFLEWPTTLFLGPRFEVLSAF
jgi:hypothetical protein